MDEKMIKQDDVVEIDLRRLFDALLNKAWVLILVSVLGAVLALVGTIAFIAPKYQSSTTFFVNNGSLSTGSAGMSSSDISASRGLVDTYIAILKTQETLQGVIDYTGMDMTTAELAGLLKAEAVDNTELFRVTFTHTDPLVAERLADAVTHVFPKRIESIVEKTTAQVVDTPVLPTAPSSPNKTTNTIIGFALGFLLAAAVVILRELFDVSVRSEEDIARVCKYTVLTSVPDMLAPVKNSGSYGASHKRQAAVDGKEALYGPNINFMASEAYKLLRTKLQYSFADEKDSYVIGVTSAFSGEGKSLTAINLSYSLAQLGKKVVLIDCDMRRPSISATLSISRFPGLSGYLVKQSHLEEVIRMDAVQDTDMSFHVITAGQTPPNPVELLSSSRMSGLLEKLRQVYDYVILDLPPVGEVSDALAVTKEADGILLVVRQNYCDRNVLGTTVRQIEYVNGRILGVVYNGTLDDGKGSKYMKYGSSAGKYDRSYNGRYANAPQQKKKPAENGAQKRETK